MDTSLRVNLQKINKLYTSYLNYKNKLLDTYTHLRITVLPHVCFTFNFHIYRTPATYVFYYLLRITVLS